MLQGGDTEGTVCKCVPTRTGGDKEDQKVMLRAQLELLRRYLRVRCAEDLLDGAFASNH